MNRSAWPSTERSPRIAGRSESSSLATRTSSTAARLASSNSANSCSSALVRPQTSTLVAPPSAPVFNRTRGIRAGDAASTTAFSTGAVGAASAGAAADSATGPAVPEPHPPANTVNTATAHAQHVARIPIAGNNFRSQVFRHAPTATEWLAGSATRYRSAPTAERDPCRADRVDPLPYIA